MDEFEFEAKFKGRKVQVNIAQDDEDESKFVGTLPSGTRVLTVLQGEDGFEEESAHEKLEYDFEALCSELESALEDDDEEDDESDDEEDESDDEDDSDDEEDDEEDDESDDEDDSDDEEDDEEDDESDDEDDSDNEEDDESDSEEVDEDPDADYGEAVETAELEDVPTVHAVIVAYGSGIAVDEDTRQVRRLLNALQDHEIAKVQEQLFHGAEATAKNALAAVKALEPAEDDIVLFYYSGHGGMDDGDRLLCTHGKLLRRTAIVDAMRRHDARLKLVLTDCCANDAGRVEASEKLGAARSRSGKAEELSQLFRNYEGLLDLSSSSDYQYSFAGVFTPALIEKTLLGNTPDTWGQVFERTQRLAMENDGALPEDAKDMLKREGLKAEDRQKPVAFHLPKPTG